MCACHAEPAGSFCQAQCLTKLPACQVARLSQASELELLRLKFAESGPVAAMHAAAVPPWYSNDARIELCIHLQCQMNSSVATVGPSVQQGTEVPMPVSPRGLSGISDHHVWNCRSFDEL